MNVQYHIQKSHYMGKFTAHVIFSCIARYLSFYPTKARWFPQLWQLKMTPLQISERLLRAVKPPQEVVVSGWHSAWMGLFSPLNMKGFFCAAPWESRLNLLCMKLQRPLQPTNVHSTPLHCPVHVWTLESWVPTWDPLSIPDSWDNKAFFIYLSYLIKLRCCERLNTTIVKAAGKPTTLYKC